MNDENIYPKSSFLMCITKMKKTENEDGESQYQVISSDWKKCSGREFRESFFEEREKGIDRTIEIVTQKPEKFVVNQIYMLATRDRVWTWIEE